MAAHQAPTKIKVGSPLAKHVPVVNFKIKMSSCLANHVQVVPTALLKPQVVHILQQHAHLEHMLRRQHLANHARPVLTLFLELEHQIVRHLVRLVLMCLKQACVIVVKWENTTTKSAPIHHLASHVNQTHTTTNEVNLTSLLVDPAVPMLNAKTACANLVLTTLPVAPLAFLNVVGQIAIHARNVGYPILQTP